MNDQAIYNELAKENGAFAITLACGNVALEFNSKTREITARRIDAASAKTKTLATNLMLLKKSFAFQTTYAEALEQIMSDYNENPISFCR